MSETANFDRIARIYRWAEYLSLGTLLQSVRTHFLPELAGRRHVLAMGDGDGRFLARLFKQNGAMQAVAVDISAEMLKLLEERCRAVMLPEARLRVWQGSGLEFVPAEDTDLVVTQFFLDCLTQREVELLAERVADTVAPGTLWLVSDFAEPHGALRWAGALYIRALYFAFHVLTGLRVQELPHPQTALEAAGFERLRRHNRLGGLIYTELWRRR